MHFQELLLRGNWEQRHVESLVSNPDAVPQFTQIIECTRDFQRSMHEANGDEANINKVNLRNKICMCHSVCSEQTMAWLKCARSEIRKHKGNAAAGNAAQQRQCEDARVALERCTQWEASRLLHAAVLRHDPMQEPVR